MAKAVLKTTETGASVEKFLDGVSDAGRREDAYAVLELMQKVTRAPPKMWGSAIVGFGSRKLVYESGRELNWPYVAFSPRKRNLVLYITDGFNGYAELMARLGKHKTGKSCLYINKLADVDMKVLKELVTRSVRHLKA